MKLYHILYKKDHTTYFNTSLNYEQINRIFDKYYEHGKLYESSITGKNLKLIKEK